MTPDEDRALVYLRAKVDQATTAVRSCDINGAVAALRSMTDDGHPELAEAAVRLTASYVAGYLAAGAGLQQEQYGPDRCPCCGGADNN